MNGLQGFVLPYEEDKPCIKRFAWQTHRGNWKCTLGECSHTDLKSLQWGLELEGQERSHSCPDKHGCYWPGERAWNHSPVEHQFCDVHFWERTRLISLFWVHEDSFKWELKSPHVLSERDKRPWILSGKCCFMWHCILGIWGCVGKAQVYQVKKHLWCVKHLRRDVHCKTAATQTSRACSEN